MRATAVAASEKPHVAVINLRIGGDLDEYYYSPMFVKWQFPIGEW
ncbi:MAG: hypothetical protein Q9M22_05465 [Mariprofundaceae bacterium]|nr:hypothetical protein [Mariprofundaceae bacterium]